MDLSVLIGVDPRRGVCSCTAGTLPLSDGLTVHVLESALPAAMDSVQGRAYPGFCTIAAVDAADAIEAEESLVYMWSDKIECKAKKLRLLPPEE